MSDSAAAFRVLVVDDDPSLRKLISIRLKGAGYQVETADSGEAALGVLPGFDPALVISDLRMDGMDGMGLFGEIQRLYPGLPVIILTAHGTIPDAVAATKQGVFGYLTKPFDSQQLLDTVAEAIQLHPGQTERTQSWRSEIISCSQIMQDLINQVQQLAGSDVSVLIHSQSGTGKELLAKAIHRASRRAEGPFIAVNCAAIPESLLESELFGHKKGAFTGADRDHPGLLQSANGGTLFLDEIGDMPLGFQVKLLRVLQEREVRPVGATQSIAIDVRVVSASHVDLEQAIKNKSFREDLYYRLNVVELTLPPLSQRREDIPLLVNHFLQQASTRSQQAVHGVSSEAMDMLVSAPWPGNIRQLMNVIERCVALSTASIISAKLVTSALRDDAGEFSSLNRAKDEFEYQYLVKLLKLTQGNVSKAAQLAQRNRTEFYKLLEKHHLKAKAFRGDNKATQE